MGGVTSGAAGSGVCAFVAGCAWVCVPAGEFLMGIGNTGSGPGQFWRPHDMAVDSKGYFYVADASNQRIQKFEIPDP